MTTADDPLPALLRSLRSHNPLERLRAAKDLGRLGWLANEAMPALIAALDDENPKVRESAAGAIGLMGPEALPTLIDMLGHEDRYVRRHAVWAMGKLGPLARPALHDLGRALKDSDPRTASGAAQALGSMGADAAGAVPALAEAMRGTNIVLCRLASKALSQVGLPALPTLIAHLQHADPFVRGESALAIGWIGPAARSAIPFLTEILRGPNAPLFSTPSPSPLTPPTLSPSPSSDTLTPPQLDTASGTSADANCRVQAAQALGRIGQAAADALSDLDDAAETGPDTLRQAARQAIRLIQSQ